MVDREGVGAKGCCSVELVDDTSDTSPGLSRLTVDSAAATRR